MLIGCIFLALTIGFWTGIFLAVYVSEKAKEKAIESGMLTSGKCAYLVVPISVVRGKVDFMEIKIGNEVKIMGEKTENLKGNKP